VWGNYQVAIVFFFPNSNQTFQFDQIPLAVTGESARIFFWFQISYLIEEFH
jgi:hypothetical protein